MFSEFECSCYTTIKNYIKIYHEQYLCTVLEYMITVQINKCNVAVDNIRMDLQEVGCGYMDWIGLAQDMDG